MAITIHNSDSYDVLTIPQGYRGIKTDYLQRFLTFYGIPIMAPGTVDDFAIQEARWTLGKMFTTSPHRIREVAATNLFITVVPDITNGYFDFGLENARIIIVGEDNLTNRNAETSILIHEIGHAVHHACCEHEKQHIKSMYESRPFWGKAETYGHKDEYEYFAEGVTAYFNAGMPGEPVRTRKTLETFDPPLHATIKAFFGYNEWQWQPVSERKILSEHTLADTLKNPIMNEMRGI